MLQGLSIALALLAGQPVNDPEGDTTFSERQPVRLAPLPAARALGAFRDICMAGFPDPAAFDRAAAASDLGFVRNPDPDRGEQEYSSRHGQIVLRQAQGREGEARRDRRQGRGARRRWQARCDFWVAVEERLNPADLAAAIGAALAPQVRPVEEIVGTSWMLEEGGGLKLVYLPSNDDPRLFTLSLQRLPDNPPG
jgi:hypothetical protein